MSKALQMPNFKLTKWQLHFCETCEDNFNSGLAPTYYKYQHWHNYGCAINQHIERVEDNIPFFVPDMKITGLFYKGWFRLESKILNTSFLIGPSKFEELVMKAKINKGNIAGSWFMYCKLGSMFSLRIVK